MGITAPAFDQRHSVGNSDCLLYMQIALFPVFSNPVIVKHTKCCIGIVNPISDIGILLYLRNQDILSDCMNRTRLYEQNISFLYWYCIEHFQKCVLLDPSCKFFFADFFFKSIIKKRFFSGIHYIPHFCFSILSFIFKGISVIRMNLNR